jgi:hypothetical protein
VIPAKREGQRLSRPSNSPALQIDQYHLPLVSYSSPDRAEKLIPSAKFHALVDADPHGIDIMQVYAKGSKSTTHSYDHANLALGAKLSWMGVKASEWIGLGVRHDDLLMLSDKDVEKVSFSLNTIRKRKGADGRLWRC